MWAWTKGFTVNPMEENFYKSRAMLLRHVDQEINAEIVCLIVDWNVMR